MTLCRSFATFAPISAQARVELSGVGDSPLLKLNLPTSPDALAIGAMLQMVNSLQKLEATYKILLTIIPPHPSTTGDKAQATIENAGLPIFKTGIRRLAVFQKAALKGVAVNQLKDSYARIAWRCYEQVGKEILK